MSDCDLANEFAGCDFGDARLSKRILQLADSFEGNPNRSIPAVFRSRAEWEACYRVFDNEAVSPENILQPHIQATRKRIKQFDVALLVQDTTELDLTRPKQQVNGAGPMDCDARRGAFFHPLVAFNCEGVALGLVGQQHWTRDEISKDTPEEKRKKRHAQPIEDKESHRWLTGLQLAKETAAACPQTTCVCTGDSESDIFELYGLVYKLRKEQPNLHLLVRAGQDRATNQEELWTAVARAAPLIATQTVHIRKREAKIPIVKSARSKSREARTAEVEIRATKVTVLRPSNLTVTGSPKTLDLNVVLVEEPNPPTGEEPICWLLVTTLPIDDDAQVQTIVRYYCLRWQIEVFFRTLKFGCRIEYRRFEELDRVLNCLALMSVLAWRVMYVTYLGRACPDLDCETIFEPSEWKSVFAVLNMPIPAQGCPKLGEVVRAIAKLGGFINRQKNNPGTQTVWTGIQRCFDLSIAWEVFGPGQKTKSMGKI